MRMSIALTTLLAVLCGAVAGASDVMTNASRVRRSPQPHHSHHMPTEDEQDQLLTSPAWKRTHWRHMQSILRRRSVVECCPSVEELVEPKGGRTQKGLFVELYRDGENIQKLYEVSCAPGVADKPCLFVDARLYNQSRCVQKYSYSYALVRSEATESPPHRHRREGQFPVPGGWSMDYVRVRAGCECQVTPPKRRTAHKKRKNKKIVDIENT